jgi:predicted PurR-regulated permease PerM
MIVGKTKRRLERFKLSLRGKLVLALSAIAAILLISSIISILEYKRMSTYVSSLIADNINNINVAQKMAEAANDYNLDILAVVGDDKLNKLPDFNREAFLARCDSLRATLSEMSLQPLADSVVYSYSAYMLTSLELPDVLLSDFIDTRTWYFDRLQPRYNRLRNDIDAMSSAIYTDLKRNSATFDRGFYRSIIPGLVAVGVGLLLVLMLLFFLMAYYVNPLYKMLANLNNYRSYNKKYSYTFEGDDQLTELNEGITEITSENQQLRKRISILRSGNEHQGDQ